MFSLSKGTVLLLCVATLIAACLPGCATTPPSPPSNAKATPAQNWALQREILTLEQNAIVTAIDNGHLKPPMVAIVDKEIQRQRAKSQADAAVIFAPASAAGIEDLLEVISDVISYIPTAIDAVEVAQLVASAPEITPERIERAKVDGADSDKEYDLRLGKPLAGG